MRSVQGRRWVTLDVIRGKTLLYCILRGGLGLGYSCLCIVHTCADIHVVLLLYMFTASQYVVFMHIIIAYY